LQECEALVAMLGAETLQRASQPSPRLECERLKRAAVVVRNARCIDSAGFRPARSDLALRTFARHGDLVGCHECFAPGQAWQRHLLEARATEIESRLAVT